MIGALVSIDTDQVWALVDLRPDEDAVMAARFAVCHAHGVVFAVPAADIAQGQQLGSCERWASVDDLSDVLRTLQDLGE